MGFTPTTLYAEDSWVELVTPEEAATRNAPMRLLSDDVVKDGNGPEIELLSPDPSVPHEAPVSVQVAFRSPQGEDIDLASLEVTYVKWINIDITDRIREYTSSEGIYIPNATLPPGVHTIRVSVSDKNGHSATNSFTVRLVEPLAQLGSR